MAEPSTSRSDPTYDILRTERRPLDALFNPGCPSGWTWRWLPRRRRGCRRWWRPGWIWRAGSRWTLSPP